MIFSPLDEGALNLEFYFGEPTANMPFTDRLLSLKHRPVGPSEYFAQPEARIDTVVTPQGTRLIYYGWDSFARTFRNRPLLRIDKHI